MLIDWFTVVAQIINFLVLVFLLKRFLYGPIINAMDRREENISARIEDARDAKTAAEDEKELYRKRNSEMDARTAELMAKAATEAESRKAELVEKAREEVDALRAEWRGALKEEKEAFLREFRTRACRQVFDVASKALRDLSGAALEDRMIEVFLEKIDELSPGPRGDKALKEPYTVSSAFDIPAEWKERIEGKLRGAAGPVEITYKLDPALICGLEFRSDGYVTGWSLDEYLRGLEEEAEKMIEEGIEPVKGSA